jgi:hypothetical protein
MNNSDNTELSAVIMQALAIKERTLNGLSAIYAHPDCPPPLRLQGAELSEKISANSFLDKEVEMGLSTILAQADGWIKAGQQTELIWDEGCPHDGWLELCLPDHLTALQQACVPVHQFRNLLCEVLNAAAVAEIIERFNK